MIDASSVEAEVSPADSQYNEARIAVANCLDIENLTLENIDLIDDKKFLLLMKFVCSSLSIKHSRPWSTNGMRGPNYYGNMMSR